MHVVFIPGYLLDHRLWSPVIRRLGSSAGVSVPDLRRFATIDAMAEHVLQNAPPHFVLAGLSMGGYVSLTIMRRAPERVQALALLNTQAGVDQPATLERREKLRTLVESGRLEEAKESLKPLMLAPEHLAPGQPARTALEAMYADCDAGLFLRHQNALNCRRDNRDVLPTINCPTLVLGSRQDALTPPAVQQAMAEIIPRTRLVILEECGHLSPLARPDAVAESFAGWVSDLETQAAGPGSGMFAADLRAGA